MRYLKEGYLNQEAVSYIPASDLIAPSWAEFQSSDYCMVNGRYMTFAYAGDDSKAIYTVSRILS